MKKKTAAGREKSPEGSPLLSYLPLPPKKTLNTVPTFLFLEAERWVVCMEAREECTGRPLICRYVLEQQAGHFKNAEMHLRNLRGRYRRFTSGTGGAATEGRPGFPRALITLLYKFPRTAWSGSEGGIAQNSYLCLAPLTGREGERMTEMHHRLVLLKLAWSFKDPIVRGADRQAAQSVCWPNKHRLFRQSGGKRPG